MKKHAMTNNSEKLINAVQPKRARINRIVVTVLIISLVFLFFASFFLGRYPITAKEVMGIFYSKTFLNNIWPIDAFWTSTQEAVTMNIRLPRIILACLVGCCLSTAGATYQGVFQNPMASPDILGATNGAAFGAALALLNGQKNYVVMISAFFFSILTVVLVNLIASRAKGSKILGLVLSGIMVSSLFSAGTSYIKLVADPNDVLPEITYWLMGSLAGATIKEIGYAIIPMIIGTIPIFLLRWRINILSMGDEEARTMGVNAPRVRLIMIISSTLITAASVSISGVIGWVGLVVPHLARRLVGNNYKYLIPSSMLFGSIFLLLVDNVSRNLWETEIPIGILTAVIGAPFFIYLIIRRGDYE